MQITELSIIIPTLNEANYLPKLLSSIAQQQFSGRYEVIVVDCGSQDETVQRAQTFCNKIDQLTVLTTKKGIAHQRNLGASKAKYDYLLFVDADVMLPPRFLERICQRPYKDTRFIDFPLHLPIKPNLADYLFVTGIFSLTALAQFTEPILLGSCIFTTKANHLKIKGFREDLQMWEDMDYGHRSFRDGAKYHIRWRPNVVMSPRRMRRHGRMRIFLFGIKCYFYTKKYGYEYSEKLFDKFGYTFGNFKDEN